MHRLLMGACLFLALAGPRGAVAEEDAERLLTAKEAAEVAAVLVRTKADDMLRRLAARDEPDPWRVADVLCSDGAVEAAVAFAAAAPRADTRALADYVRSVRGKDASASRKALARAREHLAAGEVEVALGLLESTAQKLDDVPSITATYGRGELLAQLGRPEAGRTAFVAAAQAALDLGWLRFAASAFQQAGRVAYENAELRAASGAWTRRLEVEQQRESLDGVAEARANIAAVHQQRGDYRQALSQAKLALERMEEAENHAGVARTLANIGTMYRALGDHARALACAERAQRILTQLELHAEAAHVLANEGNIYAELGDHGRAIALLRRARDILAKSGDPRTVLRLDISLAGTLADHGEPLPARALLNAALRKAAAVNDRLLMVRILENLGDVQRAVGESRAALASYRQALTTAREIEDREGMARALVKEAVSQAELGHRVEAIGGLEAAVREAEGVRSPRILVAALTAQASLQLAEGHADLALSAAKRAVPLADQLVRGQEVETGARARAQYEDLYALGALAAADLGDAAELGYFLEKGRAGAFLEGFEARDVLRSTRLPPDLLEEELRARYELERQLAAYRLVSERGKRTEVRAARAELDRARDALQTVRERVARHEKTVAGLLSPRAATTDEIRRALGPDELVVLFGLFAGDGLALVLARDGERIVRLGKTSVIEEICRRLHLEDQGEDPQAALAELRKVVYAPLGIPAGTKRVQISPSGALSYVPLGLLAPDLEVAYVSSATLWLTLRELPPVRPGGVLAVGDPDYESAVDRAALALYARGRPLSRLGATADEARKVGDIVLLREHATKSNVRRALAAGSHWRAVHLSCHGLLNPDEPMLSSLALTAEPDDGGFLSTAEVFHWDVPTDLAVLSACETGKGKIYKAEGIFGLTRAFMFAGARRVICSLWKVDDEATQTLMIKFYELWNPNEGKGLGAAAALQKAQAYVRDHPDHPRWKHPYYWAAWVLWGLPD